MLCVEHINILRKFMPNRDKSYKKANIDTDVNHTGLSPVRSDSLARKEKSEQTSKNQTKLLDLSLSLIIRYLFRKTLLLGRSSVRFRKEKN